jgi:hypothetical protein
MSTARSIGTMELTAGSQVLPVLSLGTEIVSLGGRIGDAAARLDRFVFSVLGGPVRIDVPFSGHVAANGGEIVVAEADRALLAAAASGRLDALVTPATARATRRRRTRAGMLAILVIIALGGYVGVRLWSKTTSIEPRIAYLATEVTTLLSPTSGRVSFVEDLGPVDQGQPAVGLETTSGKSLLIDAPGNVDIVAAEKAVGERVKRGDPLLAYAKPDAPLYLRAVVDHEQAFRIAAGTTVSYSRIDTPADTVRFEAAAADLHIRALPAEGDHQLYEIRIPLPAGEEQFRALPVHLRFEQDLAASLIEALRSIGLPGALLDGLAALEGTTP